MSESPPNQASPVVDTRAQVECLFRKYRESLLRHLKRLLRNPQDAQELLQETYVRVLQQVSLDKLEANNRAYLFRIASNLVIDKARKDKRQFLQQHEFLEEEQLVSSLPSPQKMAESSQAMRQLKTVLASLTPRCRQIFILNRFKEMTYPEIAERLGVTTRTVERQMSIAMTLCQEKLRASI